jgi:hypothetical protein
LIAEYIHGHNINEKNKIEVWPNCENNRKKKQLQQNILFITN